MADNFYTRGPDEITEKFYGDAAAKCHQERFDEGLIDDWVPVSLDVVRDVNGIRSTLVLHRVVRVPKVNDEDNQADEAESQLISFYAKYESRQHPGWYDIVCAPIGLIIDLTDGNVTCYRCRLNNGRWLGAEHISPMYWRPH